jgi:hypothetical protein
MTASKDTTTDDPYASVPEDLKRRNQGVAFRFEDDPKNPHKRKKRPINPKTGGYAAVNDSDTWGSFDEAVAAIEKYGLDGIGYVFSSGDPYCGFDFDNVLQPYTIKTAAGEIQETGYRLNPEAAEVLQHLEPYGYAEESVSGTGIHVILRGKLPRHSAKKHYGTGESAWSAEAYDQDRYFVVTGKKRGHPSTTLSDAQGAITQAWATLGWNQAGDEGDEASGVYAGDVWQTGISSDKAVSQASSDRDGERFRAAWAGDLTPFDGDNSKADFYLCRRLGFYLGPDPTAIEETARGSKLTRAKWDDYRGADTYLSGTIGAALRWVIGHGGFYDRNKKNGTPPEEDGELVVIEASDVKVQTVDWLWDARIPTGKISFLDGDPGEGKSVVSNDLAARTTRGDPMPGDPEDARRDPANAIIITAEDDPADTIVPRLIAANADLSRVSIVQMTKSKKGERVFDVTTDLPKLYALAEVKKPALVIIDPVQAHLGNTNLIKMSETRAALAPVAVFAQRTRVAVLILRHLNKQGGTKALYRGSGSMDMAGIARSVLMAAHNKRGDRYLLRVKCNLAPQPKALQYTLAGDVVRVEWGAESDIDPDDLLNGEDKAKSPEQQEILDVLTQRREKVREGATCGEAMTVREIATAMGYRGDYSTVSRMLNKLTAREAVHNPKYGYYALPPDGGMTQDLWGKPAADEVNPFDRQGGKPPNPPDHNGHRGQESPFDRRLSPNPPGQSGQSGQSSHTGQSGHTSAPNGAEV